MQFRSLLVKCLKRLRIVKNIKERSKRELIMTKEDEINFQMAKKLYDKKILELKILVTWQINRDSAKQIFNANYRLTKNISMIFHNLRGNHITR